MSFYSRTLRCAPHFLVDFLQWIAILLGPWGPGWWPGQKGSQLQALTELAAVVPLDPSFQELGPPSALVGWSQGCDDRPAILDAHPRHRPPQSEKTPQHLQTFQQTKGRAAPANLD